MKLKISVKGTILVLVSTVIFFGCPKRPKKVEITPPQQPVSIPSEEPNIRGDEFVSVPELRMVNFEFDSAELTEQAKSILRENVRYLTSNPDLEILVEGHCDERGTIEYNLGLGQRRANSVRNYYISLGIPAGRIATISYGEEKPLDPASNEEAWTKNRRAETKVRQRRR